MTAKEWNKDNTGKIKEVRFLQSQQLAYPLGPDKDAINILTWLQLDPVTNKIITHSSAELNSYYGSQHPKHKYLGKGTYLECYNIAKEYINNNY